LPISQNQVPSTQNDFSSEISTNSVQGSEVPESTEQRASNDFAAENEASTSSSTLKHESASAEDIRASPTKNDAVEESMVTVKAPSEQAENARQESDPRTIEESSATAVGDDRPVSTNTNQVATAGIVETDGLIAKECVTDDPVAQDPNATDGKN
jgi:hypothetical protein